MINVAEWDVTVDGILIIGLTKANEIVSNEGYETRLSYKSMNCLD